MEAGGGGFPFIEKTAVCAFLMCSDSRFLCGIMNLFAQKMCENVNNDQGVLQSWGKLSIMKVQGKLSTMNKYCKGETTMMKRLKNMLFSAMLLLLAACMLFTGCGQKTTPPDNGDGTQNEGGAGNGGETNESQGGESRFDFSGGETPASGCSYAAYKIDKTEYDIDDVSLEFFYGIHYDQENIDPVIALFGYYPWFEIGFSNDDKDIVWVRRVEEEFVSEKYYCELKRSPDRRRIIGIEYNHSEILTIPKELFTKESGCIIFSFNGERWKGGEVIYNPDAYLRLARLYYKVTGDTVVLSNKPFEK